MISQELKRLYLLAPSLGLSGSKETKRDSCPGPMGCADRLAGLPRQENTPRWSGQEPQGLPWAGKGAGSCTSLQLLRHSGTLLCPGRDRGWRRGHPQ